MSIMSELDSSKRVQVSSSINDNVFSVIGSVSKALKRAGRCEDALLYSSLAMKCGSYDEVLQLSMLYAEFE